MNIPINSNFVFTVKVLAEDSFLPQDLDTLTDARFVVMTKSATPTLVEHTEVLYPAISTATPPEDENGYIKTTYANFTDTTTTTVTYTDGLWHDTNTPAPESVPSTGEEEEGTTTIGTFYKIVEGSDVRCEQDDPLMDHGTIVTTVITNRTTNSGILTITMNSGENVAEGYSYGTSALSYEDTYSAKEDGFFSKPTYKGSLVLKFSNRSDINVIIEDITAMDIGAV